MTKSIGLLLALLMLRDGTQEGKVTMQRCLIAFLISLIMSFSFIGGLAHGEEAPSDSSVSSGGAAPTAQSVVSVRSSETVVKGKTSGADLSLTFAASARRTEDESRTSATDFELAAWKAIGKRLRVDGYVGATRDTNGLEETKLADARIGILHNPILIARRLQYRPKLTIFLPTDSDRRKIDSFRTGISLNNRLSFQKQNFFSFYQLSATKNFYQYETSGNGESNPSHSFSHTLNLNYAVGNFYVGFTPNLVNRWTFSGTPSTSFSLSEEFGYGWQDWMLAIGHTNSDSLYKANGADTNFTFFNGNTSKYYLTANYTF